MREIILRDSANSDQTNCGLVPSDQEIMLICYRSILDSTRTKMSRGTIVLGRLLDAAMQQRWRNQAGLYFSIMPVQQDSGRKLMTGSMIKSSFGQDPILYKESPSHYELYLPLHDLNRTPIGELRLSWPRTIMARGLEMLARTQWVLISLTLFGAMGMLLVIDRVLVIRLKRLALQVSEIRISRNWQARLKERGRDEITQLSENTNEFLHVIDEQFSELEQCSLTDPLTQLGNRRAYERRLAHVLRHSQRNGHSLCLMMLDIDHFKLYNDGYGHQAGDLAIKAIAQCLSEAAQRGGDLPCRLGGEEFCVIMADCSLQEAEACAQKVRGLLAQLAIEHRYSPTAALLTVSIGIYQMTNRDDSDSLYAHADAALYQAKHSGRDRVFVSDSHSILT